MYINSPGGSVTAGLSVYDTMQYVQPKISTLCLGQACSFGSVFLMAGDKGNRFCLPNARVMIHQPHISGGGISGQASDIEIHAKEIVKLKAMLNKLYVKHTGQTLSMIEKKMDRDYFMSPEEAKKFGLIDKIVDKHPNATTDKNTKK